MFPSYTVSIPIIHVRVAFSTSPGVSVNYLVLLFYCEIGDLFHFLESVASLLGTDFCFPCLITETVVFSFRGWHLFCFVRKYFEQSNFDTFRSFFFPTNILTALLRGVIDIDCTHLKKWDKSVQRW